MISINGNGDIGKLIEKNIEQRKDTAKQIKSNIKKATPVKDTKIVETVEQVKKIPDTKQPDNSTFNKKFEEAIKALKARKQSVEKEQSNYNIPYYKLSIYDILIGIVDTWFDILADIITFNLNDIITKNNRLFYIGITLVIFGLILYLYFEFYNKIEQKNEELPQNINEILELIKKNKLN